MAAKKGNKYAQKHSVEHVIAVLEDVVDGMLKYSANQQKTKSDTLEITGKTTEGYSCIERGLLSHGHYSEKLCEWEKTHADNEEVSQLIKKARKISNDMIFVNTVEGQYAPNIGIFMCKARLGMVEKGVDDHNKSIKTLLQFEAVPAKKNGDK